MVSKDRVSWLMKEAEKAVKPGVIVREDLGEHVAPGADHSSYL